MNLQWGSPRTDNAGLGYVPFESKERNLYTTLTLCVLYILYVLYVLYVRFDVAPEKKLSTPTVSITESLRFERDSLLFEA